MLTNSHNLLSEKINFNKDIICILGLAYVGLPLVKRFLQLGCKKIFGVVSDERKIKLLQFGKLPIHLYVKKHLLFSLQINISNL